jgi:hypothetical protein
MSDKQRALFAFGQAVECGFLPESVVSRRVPMTAREYLSDCVPSSDACPAIVTSCQLASQSRHPHQLLPDENWPALLRFHIERFSLDARDVTTKLETVENRFASGTLTAGDVRNLAEEI